MTRLLTIDKLVPGGAGYARLSDGRSAFVDGALPGDRVRVERQLEKKGYVEVVRFTLDQPGPERISPPCAIAEACGGCDWMALDYRAQREHKAALIAEALERTGRLRVAAPIEIVSAGEPLAYRLRARLHVDLEGRVGFFGRRTQVLVPVPACAVADTALNEVLRSFAELAERPRRLLGRHVRTVDLRVVPEGGGLEVELEPRQGETPGGAFLDELRQALGERVHVGVATARRSGLRRYPLPGGGFLRVPSAGFTQVNWAVNAALVAAVVARARKQRAARFLDLYAGVGNFSVPLALAGFGGVAIELDRTAVAAQREALREQGLAGVEVVAGDVPTALARNRSKLAGVEFVLLDPPRAGAKDALAPLAALRPSLIGYVACDPVTLGRDARRLVDAGFELESVVGFDMFPQTHHVETLAWFRAATAR